MEPPVAQTPAPVSGAVLHLEIGSVGGRSTAEKNGGKARYSGGADEAEYEAAIMVHGLTHITWAVEWLLPRLHCGDAGRLWLGRDPIELEPREAGVEAALGG